MAITGPQIVTSSVSASPYVEELLQRRSLTYDQLRALRAVPTIKLARAYILALLVANEWSVMADDDAPPQSVEFVTEQLRKRRPVIFAQACAALLDYGWAGFEKVWGVERDRRTGESRVVLRALKQLLPDHTKILIYPDGSFAGFKQDAVNGLNEVVVPLPKSLLVSINVEGQEWYGRSELADAYDPWQRWATAATRSKEYDAKIAGSRLKITYPPGTTLYEGVETPNSTIAKRIAADLASSGVVCLPTARQAVSNNLAGDELGWDVGLLEGAQQQGGFVQSMEYSDRQMVRVLGVPERALLEGRWGTRADAGEHGDASLTNIETIAALVDRHLNWHLVDQLLALNWGPEARGKVWLESAPLSDASLAFARTVYQSLLAGTASAESLEVDTAALREKLGVPALNPTNADEVDHFPPAPPEAPSDDAAEMLARIYAAQEA